MTLEVQGVRGFQVEQVAVVQLVVLEVLAAAAVLASVAVGVKQELEANPPVDLESLVEPSSEN